MSIAADYRLPTNYMCPRLGCYTDVEDIVCLITNVPKGIGILETCFYMVRERAFGPNELRIEQCTKIHSSGDYT